MRSFLLCLLLIWCIPSSGNALTLDHATFKVGERFFSQGLYTEAEARFLDIVRKYPDSQYYRQSLFYLGQTYAYLGKYKSALQYYRILMNKSRTVKEKQSALLGIAKSWLQMGVHGKAAEFYSFFSSEYPESEYAPAALYFAGIARERENKIPAAVEKYRSVLELYPHSTFYSKAIEKVAVLEQDTPETLWQENQVNVVKSVQPSSKKIELFADDQFNLEDAPGYNNTSFRAQSVSEPVIVSEPSVITQIVLQPSEPVIITQLVEVSPQPRETQSSKDIVKSLPKEDVELIESSVVYLSNDQFVPAETTEQAAKKRELEAYKKIWEQEYQAQLKEQELSKAAENIKEMVQIAESKAQVLQVKETSLLEKQNNIRSAFYQELKELEKLESMTNFDSPPRFTTIPKPQEVRPIPNTTDKAVQPEENTADVIKEAPIQPEENTADVIKEAPVQPEENTEDMQADSTQSEETTEYPEGYEYEEEVAVPVDNTEDYEEEYYTE